jgi:hypothetical protein
MTTQTIRFSRIPVLGAAVLFTLSIFAVQALPASAMTSTMTPDADPRITTTLEEDHVIAMISVSLLDEIQSEVVQAMALNGVSFRGPFVNVARSESRQAQNLLNLLNQRGLAAPVAPWTTTEVGTFSSRAEACEAAATAERETIFRYVDFLAHDLPTDVRRVFEQNLRVSLENHLPALERCSTR